MLARPRFRRWVSLEVAAEFIDGLAQDALVLDDPPAQPGLTADPDDDYLIALARAAGADYLVSATGTCSTSGSPSRRCSRLASSSPCSAPEYAPDDRHGRPRRELPDRAQPRPRQHAALPAAPADRRRRAAQGARPLADDRARLLPPARRVARRRRDRRTGRDPQLPAPRRRDRPRPGPRAQQPLADRLHQAQPRPRQAAADDLLADRPHRPARASRPARPDAPRLRLDAADDPRSTRASATPTSSPGALSSASAARCRSATTPSATASGWSPSSSARRPKTSPSHSSTGR